MTASQMITKFRVMVDDRLDSTYELQLVNDAINEIEAMRDWEILKKTYNFTVNSGDTFETLYTLPVRFMSPLALFLDTSYIPYQQVSMEDTRMLKDATYAFVINYADNALQILGGQSQTQQAYLIYTQGTEELDDSDTWVFPVRFHQIVPYKMAQIYYATNGGEKARSWDDRWKLYYDQTLNQMLTWDSNMKLRARKGATRFGVWNPRAINFWRGNNY